MHSRGENGSVRMDSLLVIQRAFTKVEYFVWRWLRFRIFQERQRCVAGCQTAPFYDWLAANDANFHRDLLIVRNGVKLGDDDELAFELSELDTVQIFDQPKGIVSDILSPIFKVVGRYFRFSHRSRPSPTPVVTPSIRRTIA
jgi:hypothetical protein